MPAKKKTAKKKVAKKKPQRKFDLVVDITNCAGNEVIKGLGKQAAKRMAADIGYDGLIVARGNGFIYYPPHRISDIQIRPAQ